MSDVRQKLRDWQEKFPQFSLTKIAKELGFSQGTMSQWLSGTYPGNNERVEKAVDAFLVRQQEKKKLSKFDVRFVDTENAVKVHSLCRIAHLDHKLCVLSADSGLGKTIALQRYAEENEGTIYVEIDHSFNRQYLFQHLRGILGRPTGGLLEHIFADIVATLKDSERLLIIDQAEILKPTAIDMLRCLHDKTGIGIVIAGMPKLIENIRGKRSEYAQIYTRIGSSMRLAPLTEEDVRLIVEAHIPGINGLSSVFYSESRRCGRTLAMLLFNVLRISEANNLDITERLIRESAKVLEV